MKERYKQPVEIGALPSQLAPLIGRAKELAEITELLPDPACRLLTLFGPGGGGKTRLAIQTALELRDTFANGVYFVGLQSISSAEFLASAVADAIHFPLAGQEEPARQLLHYLADQEMLLVLDNFEQLLTPPPGPQPRIPEGEKREQDIIEAERQEVEDPSNEAKIPPCGGPGGGRRSDRAGSTGTELLVDILQAAPAVKLLVTSREVLNIQEEWLYAVPSLSFPTLPQTALSAAEGTAESLEAYGAVQLFVERACRIRRDFSLADEQADVVRICQLVDGMPLAIELAASWTKTLPCRVIAAEIEQNLDFLATRLRDVPERQRSMRAVFDQSWKLLGQKEQDVFKRLAVFRGGFRYEAAQRVAGASLATLSTLVDKSLLQADPDGRYQLHELLRQYAAEHLVQSPEAIARVYDLHCAYYADFLQQRAKVLDGSEQRAAIEDIAAELENVRAAWQWAVHQARTDDLRKGAYAFYHFCDFQSRYQEGTDAFEKAVQSLDEIEPAGQQGETLALLLVLLGWNYIRLGKLEQARAVLERSQALLNDLNVPPSPGFATDPLTGLGLLAKILGDYTTAAELGEQSRQLNESRGDKQNLQMAYYVLANAAFAQGAYEEARHYAQQAYGLNEAAHNRWFSAYILTDLGNVARALGDYDQARRYYQASYAIRQAFNDPEGMAVALNHLAMIACLQEAHQEAAKLYQQSRIIYQKIGDQGGLATSLTGLGLAACALGDYRGARQYFQQALQITTQRQFVPLTLTILIGVGELLLRTGQPKQGIELLAFVDHHPASERETKARAQQSLTRYEAKLAPELFAEARQRGASNNLEAVVAATQMAFVTPDADVKRQEAFKRGSREAITPSPLHPRPPASLHRFTPALVEQLTSRELEVLHLIATGMTNKQMAEELIISVGTAKWYTSQIYGKLNVSNRTQAVARARELALLS